MRYDILLSILFDLLQNRRVTAGTLAEKYGLSPRTVHRYVDKLSPALPLHVLRGRGGGVCLSDDYRLPTRFFTAEEHAALLSALRAAYAQAPDEALLSASRKLTAAKREEERARCLLSEGDLLFLPAKGEERLVRQLKLVQEGLREKRLLRLLYNAPPSEGTFEPHLLVVEGQTWKVYGFCHTRRQFLLLPFEEIRGVLLTNESFRPRPLSEKDFFSLASPPSSSKDAPFPQPSPP